MRRVGEGLLHRTLAKADWTHEAHLAACAWLILERPEIVPERDLPGLIRSFNRSIGTVNDDTQGYHETLTQLYVRAVRHFVAKISGEALVGIVNALLASDIGAREWPLRFYSRERLFSKAARAGWIEPDVAEFLL